MSYFLLALFIASVASGCHPECSWECSDPVCRAVVVSVCQPVNCTYNCTAPEDTCQAPACSILCPADQCESDDCPACDIECEILHCSALANCTAYCAAPECSWYATKPTDCPAPVCELMCEATACAGDAPPVTSVPMPPAVGLSMGGIIGISITVGVVIIGAIAIGPLTRHCKRTRTL